VEEFLEVDMVTYPISVHVPSSLTGDKKYKGMWPHLVEKAKKVEDYINQRAEGKAVTKIDYWEIASAVGVTEELVKRFLEGKGGSHGITVHNPNLAEE
jgi:hypothetical protein